MAYKNQRAQYEIIADEMELAILNDTAGFEEKLPSEQFLADAFSVSRPVIREALKILKERGLIETHQGAPTYVTKPGVETLTKNIERIAAARSITPEQIYQVRIILETHAAGLAATNATKEDIEHMKECNIRRFKKGTTPEEGAKADVEFHGVIAHASGNPLIEMMHSSMQVLMYPVLAEIIENDESEKSGKEFHKKIIKAIEDGDSESAAELAKAHLLLSVRNYEFSKRRKSNDFKGKD